MATIPKSDSTTSLSSLISISSKISEIVVRSACIICLGEEGSLKNSTQDDGCSCSYYFHEECLKVWHTKHSTLCPICRQPSKYMILKLPKKFTTWQKFLFVCAGLSILAFLIGMGVKLLSNN